MSQSPNIFSPGQSDARIARAPADPAVIGILYAVGAFFMWGLAPLFFRALRPATPIEILSHRVVWSLLLMIVLVAVLRDLRDVPRALSSLRKVGLYTVTTALVTTNWGLFIWAVNSDHIVQTSLGYYINPLVNVLLGMLFLGERLNRKQALSGAGDARRCQPACQSWGTAVDLAYAGDVIRLLCPDPQEAAIDPLVGLLVETAMLTPLALGYLLWLWGDGTATFPSAPGMASLLIISGVITALPLIFFNLGAQRLKLSTVGLMQYLAPTLQLAIGVMVFGEEFTGAHGIAFGLIWLALAIYSTDAFLMHRARH